MEYNTVEIRRIAKKIADAAERTGSIGERGIPDAARPLESAFQGEAATTLNTRWGELQADLAGLQRGLNGLSVELYQFVRRLEAADQEAKKSIQQQ